MAFTFKSKRLGYDNIAAGSAAGKELIVVAGGDGDGETTRLTLSQRGTSTSNLSQGMPERVIGAKAGTVTDWNTPAQHPRPTSSGTSDTSPWVTSGTSDTSAFPERLG